MDASIPIARQYDLLQQYQDSLKLINTSFVSILTTGAYFKTSEPRDLIYGYLGMAPGHIAKVIKPDHGITVEVV